MVEDLETGAEGVADGRWRPDFCPFTMMPFFMWIEHPERGDVPTYGGPFDSYTIPVADWEPGSERRNVLYHRERYDHDAGGWVEGVEVLPLRVVTEDFLFDLEGDS